ncbi:MAG TPA: RICIN domain-containing protein [Polyangiaceae bacterium]|nr:RICIN domain-containing protein [Polyangiaceae bacterium]
MCPHNAARIALGGRFVRLGGLFVLALAPACRTTPLDVVYSVDVASVADGGSDADAGPGPDAAGAGGGGAGAVSGGAGGVGGTDAGSCLTVGAGRYVLRSQANGLCLGQGALTTVVAPRGYLLDFALDCRLPARSWQLSATATPNVFSFQNLSSGYVLDVQMAATRDTTPVITYMETGYDNQRFEVRARDTFTSELRPMHHPQSCVSATPASAQVPTASSAQITTCDPADPSQAWQLQRSDCL